jgi:hypothetical protein
VNGVGGGVGIFSSIETTQLIDFFETPKTQKTPKLRLTGADLERGGFSRMTQSETIFFCVILKIRLSPEIGSDEFARPPCRTANFMMLRWDAPAVLAVRVTTLSRRAFARRMQVR